MNSYLFLSALLTLLTWTLVFSIVRADPPTTISYGWYTGGSGSLPNSSRILKRTVVVTLCATVVAVFINVLIYHGISRDEPLYDFLARAIVNIPVFLTFSYSIRSYLLVREFKIITQCLN